MNDHTVVVVGAGTVGLMTALGLARNGFDVTVLEQQVAPATGPRDMVYNWCVLPMFERYGALDAMRAHGVVSHAHTVKDLATGETVALDMDVLGDVAAHPYNLHVPQQHATSAITDAIATMPNVRVEWGTEVTGVELDAAGVTVSARSDAGDSITRADWLVGADGSRSAVRRGLGLSLTGTTWPERLVSVDLRFDLGTVGHGVASQQLDLRYGALIGKADENGLWRYTFAESRLLPEDGIADRAAEVFAEVLPRGSAPGVESVTPFRVHQRSADRYRVGRAVLVGDAAHITPPTLALGMLSGLFDAESCVEALSAVAQDSADDDVLDRYSEDRQARFRDITSPRSAEMMERVFAPGGRRRIEDSMASARHLAEDADARRRFFQRVTELAPAPLLAGRTPIG